MTTLSPDGRSRWNGSMWVSVAFSPPTAAPMQPRPTSRIPTDWTRPLSYSVAGWYLLRAIYVVATPFLLAGPLAGYLNQVMQRQAQLDPNAAPLPADMLTILNNFMIVGFAIGAAIGVAISVVAIIGALQRWTWVFYVVLVLLGFETLSLPFAVFSAFTTSLSPVKLPVGLTAASLAFGAAGAALFIWMLVAIFRRGPWAMTRAPLS